MPLPLHVWWFLCQLRCEGVPCMMSWMLVSSPPYELKVTHVNSAESRLSAALMSNVDVTPSFVADSINSYRGSSLLLSGLLSFIHEIVIGLSPSASHLIDASCPFRTVSARNFDLKWAATVMCINIFVEEKRERWKKQNKRDESGWIYSPDTGYDEWHGHVLLFTNN